MKLRTINAILRRVGIVLVISTGNAGEPTTLWFERSKKYDSRTRNAS